MIAKVKTAQSEKVFSYSHVTITDQVVEFKLIGKKFDFYPDGPSFILDDDNEGTVFLMNEGGHTVDSYRWPLKKGKED